jgi:uncharacterized protein (TIGR03435 family)
MRFRSVAVVLTLTAATSITVVAQTTKTIAFEVASVRVGDSRTLPSRTVTDQRVDLVSYPTREILVLAFGVEAGRVIAPDWVIEHRLDIHATIPPGVTRQQVPAMLQTLLAERLGLVARTESRLIDVYELLVATDGIRMPEVEPINELTKPFSDPSGQPPLMDTVSGPPENQTRTIVVGTRTRIVTASTLYESQRTERGSRQIDAARMTMPELTQVLRASLDRPVIDKTALTGGYRFRIDLPPAAGAVRVAQRLGLTNLDGSAINADPSGASAFKAVETLGLKLEPGKAPVPFLVVDKIERNPTPN